MKTKNLLFAVMTALFLLAAPNLRAASSGKCGDNVKWSLSVRGVLTISGTGAMYDYTFGSPAPWKDQSFTSAVIKDGVTTIGNDAFASCKGLTSVNIPNSVTSIGEWAFAWCEGLTKIESLAENPPVCDKYPFSGVDKDKCVLSVPKNSVEAYKSAEGWKDFSNIVTGIVGVAQGNSVGVSAKNGVISVTGATGNAVVEVYGTNGAQVYRGTSKTVNVPSAGMYIVRAAGKTFKVNTAK